MAKALLVSSDEESSYLYGVAIKFQKIEVETVKSVEAAAQKLLSSLYDLVVMDLKSIDIAEVSKLTEVKKKVKALPTIILTELDPKEVKKQACLFGACEILAKKEASVGSLIKKVRQTVKK